MNWPRPRTSLAVARTEYRRSLRMLAGNTVQLLGIVVMALFFAGLPTVGGAYVAIQFGDQILGTLPVLDGLRVGFPMAWVFLTFIVVSRAVGKTGRIEHEAGLLTTVPAADVLGGLVGAEAARLLSVVAVPLVVVSASFAVALGAPVVFVTALLAALGAFATALLVGHILGVVVKVVFGQSELLTRYKSVVAALAFLVYLVTVSSPVFADFLANIMPLLQSLPMAWFGDLLALGLPEVAASLPRAVGALALVVVAVPALVALDVRLAVRLWYGDRAQPAVRSHDSSSGTTNAAFLSRVASGPTRTVTAKVWRRTLRAPLRLVYVAYPLFVLITPIQRTISSGSVPVTLPLFLSICLTWAVGAAALNPFGDEGALLPVTLTTPLRGGEFVRGHVLAVTVIGLPLVVVLTAVTGALSPLSTPSWVGLTIVSAGLAVVGPVVALGVGSLFPRFGTARVTRSREVVVPSKTAFAVYSLLLVVGFVGGAVAVVPGGANVFGVVIELVATLLGADVTVAAESLRLAGGAVALALAVGGPVLAYRSVVSRFESYTLG